MANRAVFLDRDRTIIEDPGYISDPGAVKLLPGADVAIKGLRQGGYLAVVVTNQSAIARGLITEETLERIHGEMRRQLAAGGAHLDALYYCPFHPEGTVEPFARDSDLRKPQPGMLLKAAKDLDIDLSASWMVGDSPRDIEAGQRAGCRTIRIRVPQPLGAEPEDENVQPDFTVRNLLEAAKLILQAPARAQPRATAAVPPAAAATAGAPGEAGMADREILLEVLREVRDLARKVRGKGG
jgi:D-glycero-D-manno-heptose 1,7-bisphosphate phosphatase